MEELLANEIVDKLELPDLSPDKVHIQLADIMVKDIQTHPKLKSDSLQRKIVKRSKDCNKIGKEIVKPQNSFQNISIKNQIMLKNAVKYVDILKSQHINGFDDKIHPLEQEEEIYLKSIADMNLVLKNNAEFKINEKPNNKIIKFNSKLNYYKNSSIVENVNSTTGKIEDSIDEILRVECTFSKPNKPLLEIKSEEMCEKKSHVHINKECKITLHETSPRKEYKDNDCFKDDDVKDLKNILITLTMSPPTKEESKNVFSNFSRLEENVSKVNFNLEKEQKNYDTQQTTDIYDFLNVISMKKEINESHKVLMNKYVKKWKTYVSNKKRIVTRQREKTLNTFFDKLSKRRSITNESQESPLNKAKLVARDYNRYRHRYQVQKHIIALQKAKLEEQNRIIEELKYNRILEASKMSVDAMREEVRRTYYEMDKQLKPKIKCLTSELKVEIEEPSLVLHCLKVPQFLQRMEKRAREREEKHAIIRERREQMEQERIRIRQQEELARAQMDKDEKDKRMNELKDKRKRERIENIRKKQHTERMRALNVMAELHYEKTLKAKYGVRPFKLLIKFKRDNVEKAEAHYEFQIKKTIFFKWMWYTEDMWYERNFKAEDFHRKKILRKIFDGFRQNHHNYVLKRQVAEDYYDLYVSSLVFTKLRAAVEVVKKENEHKFQKAMMYHNSNLLFRAFCYWRTLPALNSLKREQEIRKARWREKVLQVVPDYTPPED